MPAKPRPWRRSCPIRSAAVPENRPPGRGGRLGPTRAGRGQRPIWPPASDVNERPDRVGSGLALAGLILYKPAFPDGFARPAAWAARAPLQEISHGRSETKNLAVAPRHAPVRRRAQE